jgi:PIN domain nuclease of toxin-antitoxin system
LDTHVLVWLVNNSGRLGSNALALIEDAAQNDQLFVSAITPWEIALLQSKGRLGLNRDVGDWIAAALTDSGINLSALKPEIAVNSTRLPEAFHSDPADRIIAATARYYGDILITEDQAIIDYAAKGHLVAVRASL